MTNKKIGMVLVFVWGMLVATVFTSIPAVMAEDGQNHGQNVSFFSQLANHFKQFFKDDDVLGDKFPPAFLSGKPNIKISPRPIPSGFPLAIDQLNEMRLAKLVKQGKITEAQKAAIIAEQKVIQEKFMAIYDELIAWAKDQGIDKSYVMFGWFSSKNQTKPTGSN